MVCRPSTAALSTQEATRRTARRHEKAEMCYNPYAIMMKAWTAFLLVCAAASVVAWLVALYHENRVCPFTAVERFMRGLPWGGRLAVIPLFVALIVYGGTKTGNVGANQVSGRVESVEGVDNVANVEVLPVANPNTQLENDTGNWQQSHTGNINDSHLSSPITHPSSPLQRFTYVYMTSDRVRHRGEIMAETKEDAYSRLRAQKIRPIRVLAEGEAEPPPKIFPKKG